MLTRFSPVIYVQITPDRLWLRDARTGEAIDEPPEVALSAAPGQTILAIGSQARAAVAASAGALLVNPFAHPRSLVSDFIVAEQLLKHQLRRVLGKSLLTLAPSLVMHPQGPMQGGLTQVERRALHEMGRGAGAAKVNLWVGRPLTDEEVMARRPPAGDGEWE